VLKNLKTFYRFLSAYPKAFIAFILALLGLAVAENIQPYFYKLFIEAAPGLDKTLLLKLLLAFILVRLANLVFDILTYSIGDLALIPASKDARVSVVKKIQDLDFAYHTEKSTGSLISVIRRGDGAFFSLFHSFNRIFRVAIGFLIALVYFSATRPSIALLIFVSIIINLFLTKLLIKKNITTRRDFNKSEDEVTGVITDNLLNYETVKLFAKEDWEIRRLNKKFVPWMQKLWDYAMSFRFFDIGIGLPANLSLFLILSYAIRQTLQGTYSVGDLALIIGFLQNFFGQFFELLWNFRDMAKNYTDLSKYFSVLDKEIQVKDPQKSTRISSVAGEINFEKVSFSYPGGKGEAIKDLDLWIRQGESVAFVGRSGAGKTTIVKLLMRFYDPQDGVIKIDGVDIKKLKKSHLRSLIGIVPQEPILFNNTIAFNIGYGITRPPLQQIRAAARLANLSDFIETLPQKYQTNVGERGIKLSGGQKQRLAIARMILSDPEIIVFDEATSNLDSESERLIQDAFWKMSKNKTTIIIAHRLSTVMRADKIVVMEDGQIKEIGSHRSLLRNPQSLYRHFWNLQLKKI
jgi:ATP-binding cassette, subfamily B, heavy metal transporter